MEKLTYYQGNNYAACRPCAEYIDVVDIEGLIDHILRLSPNAAKFRERDTISGVRAGLLAMHNKFVPSIHTVKPIGPTPLPPHLPMIRPARLPKIRDRLVTFWRSEQARKIINGSLERESAWLPAIDCGQPPEQLGTRLHAADPEAVDSYCTRMAIGLHQAELYWISTEFTTLAVAAAQALPDLSITETELPAPRGFLVWNDPVHELPVNGGHFTADITAASWTQVPGGVWIVLYARTEHVTRHTARSGELGREIIGFFAPIAPGGGLRYGTNPETPAASSTLSVLLSTWLLMAQAGVADTVVQPAEKAVRRAYGRANRPAPDVRIVDLRRRQAPAMPAEANAPARSREYHVQWMVRGFFRDQAWGPQHSLRKRIYIAPYLKGPEDKPLKAPAATVNVLR